MVAEAFCRYGLGRHVLLLLLLAIGSGVAAHGEVIYPLYELREHEIPDFHDGSLDDWRQVMEPTFRTEDLVHWDAGLTGESAPGFPDFAAEIFLAWSSARNQILMGVEVWDDVYLQDGIRGDLVALGVDLDEDGGNPTWESQVLVRWNGLGYFGLKAFLYEFLVDGSERRVRIDDWNTHRGHGLWEMKRMELGGVVFHEEDPTRHVTEFAVAPFEWIPGRDAELRPDQLIDHSKPGELRPGEFVRLMVYFADQDVEYGSEEWSISRAYTTPLLCGAPAPFASSTCWPKFQLIGADERPTPVPQRSWGQIKAEELQEHPLRPDTDGISTDP